MVALGGGAFLMSEVPLYWCGQGGTRTGFKDFYLKAESGRDCLICSKLAFRYKSLKLFRYKSLAIPRVPPCGQSGSRTIPKLTRWI